MDYEKKYKEALERAREYWETDNDNTLDIKAKGTMEYLFPELKASDDERIRGAIIHFISHTPTVPKGIIGKKIMIAWLEKQGEQKPTWTKEDDVRLQACIDVLQAKSINGKVDTIMTKWLKSLKPQSRWKPSDEQMEVLKEATNIVGNKYKSCLNSLYSNLKKLKD